MMKSWDGNIPDNIILKERSKALIDHFKQSDVLRYLIANSKLYCKENTENLSKINFISRIPVTIKQEKEFIREAILQDQ